MLVRDGYSCTTLAKRQDVAQSLCEANVAKVNTSRKSGPPGRQTSHRNVISGELAVDALQRSGYLLETRIARALDQFATHLSVNVVFADPETGQPRELDAYCFRAETGSRYEHFTASAHVLIECVNNPQPIAFFSNERTTRAYPVTAARPRWLGLYPTEKTIGLEDFHHCFKSDLASNYCTFVEKKSHEWMATHADDQHGEFTTLAMLTRLTREKQLQVLEDYSRPQDAVQFCGVELIYPLLVAEGLLFDVRQNSAGNVHLKSVDHVTYLKRHMWRGVRRYCPIDVVTERFLPRFLRMIEVECKRTMARLEKRGEEILEAVRENKSDASDSGDPLEDFLP
jgi:hypothetical protein